jgi:hypothetical protein
VGNWNIEGGGTAAGGTPISGGWAGNGIKARRCRYRAAQCLEGRKTGVVVSDYATLMVEILKDNARPEASAVYGAIDMPWAKLVGQIAQAYGK